MEETKQKTSQPQKSPLSPARIGRLNRSKLIGLAIIGIVFGLDRLTKLAAIAYLEPVRQAPFLPGLLHFEWVTNTGAAWGRFAGQWWLLIGLTGLMLAVLTAVVLLNKIKDPVLVIMIAFFVGGGLGNLVDRIAWGYVVDFLAFSFMNFPVFNVADMAISVTAVVAVVYILFWEEKHLSHLARIDGELPEKSTVLETDSPNQSQVQPNSLDETGNLASSEPLVTREDDHEQE